MTEFTEDQKTMLILSVIAIALFTMCMLFASLWMKCETCGCSNCKCSMMEGFVPDFEDLGSAFPGEEVASFKMMGNPEVIRMTHNVQGKYYFEWNSRMGNRWQNDELVFVRRFIVPANTTELTVYSGEHALFRFLQADLEAMPTINGYKFVSLTKNSEYVPTHADGQTQTLYVHLKNNSDKYMTYLTAEAAMFDVSDFNFSRGGSIILDDEFWRNGMWSMGRLVSTPDRTTRVHWMI